MSEENSNKIGGEYGEIRSELDVKALNKWLQDNQQVRKRVKAPVAVKQFAVCTIRLLEIAELTS